MIYPDVTLEEWLKKYPGLEVFSQPCPQCKETISTKTPFITKHYAGLEGKACYACGFIVNSANLIPISAEKTAAWRKL